MAQEMKNKLTKVIVVLVFLSCLTLNTNLVKASIVVSDNVYFVYSDGSSFTNPGTYDSVERVDDVWYFNGVAYEVREVAEITGEEWLVIGLVLGAVIFGVLAVVLFAKKE
jgi:hypothetical protein